MNKRLHIILFIAIAGAFFSCNSDPEDASTDSEEYKEAVSNFYVSLGASQTEEARFAFNKMNDVAEAFPEEPVSWANLGVYAMRQGNFDLAEERFSRARSIAPENAEILYLSGIFESRRGNVDKAIEYLRTALGSNPSHERIQFSLIQELERQDDDENADELIDRIRKLNRSLPENQAVMFEMARLAAKEQNMDLLQNTMTRLEDYLTIWGDEAQEQFNIVEEVVADRDFTELNLELAYLRNIIESTTAFQEDLRVVRLEPNEIGFLIHEFIVLPKPQFRAAEPDMDITFSDYEESELPETASFVKSATLLEDLPPLPVFINERKLFIDDEVSLEFPGSEESLPPQVMAEIDYNYNFRNDIALAGDEGFRFYEQNDDQTFTDITSSLNLSSSTETQRYNGIWPADVDLDGDLDLMLAPQNGNPFVLRNNTDGTFTELDLFDSAQNIVDFRWADLDGDGAADALFLSETGDLTFYRNNRGGNMVRVENLPENENVKAIAIADMDADGSFDILLSKENELQRLSYQRGDDRWESETVITFDDELNQTEGKTTFFTPDMDNNGSLDIVLSNEEKTQIWLSDKELNFNRVEADLPGGVYSIFDINGNERLDLLGISADGTIFQKMNSGTKDYTGRSIRARASGEEGDQRINSFGIGGEMEIRSELLYQKQLITSPIVHFGLGTHEEPEMLRIIWPNGSVQAEFAELGMGATIFNEQILKGSCPWLFTNDGEEIQFITDILWRSPLGLRINAQETAGIIQTLDRVRIPGDQLKPVDGIYDVRITAELWETHFFDFVSLVAVDHPVGSEIYIDERFVFPAPDLSTRALATPKPVGKVTDQKGTDVSDTVREVDQNYLKPFEKTSYQGLVKDHYIEIDLGEVAPADEKLFLIASGWLRPTDSSINLALSQGDHEPPMGLRVEVSDGEGGWTELHENYGVPAGKLKSILLELDDVFEDSSDRRIRLHTTSEIYWDAIQWATSIPESEMIEQELKATKMDLNYRGYSEWIRNDEASPLLPVYDEISSTNQRWRDLMGYHTRFGDVTELLTGIDDRYVIMNAGDEMLLEYEALDEPKEGFTRSFVFVSDGWVKDGDYNTEASKTVTPLPNHSQSDYDYLSEDDLWSDPVFQEHREDWVNYHTRFVTPESFRSAFQFD
ncbi:MAG: FG-GAP-like repeat-containing protein [Balneolaceae bacterium]